MVGIFYTHVSLLFDKHQGRMNSGGEYTMIPGA